MSREKQYDAIKRCVCELIDNAAAEQSQVKQFGVEDCILQIKIKTYLKVLMCIEEIEERYKGSEI